jgi:hypothetical protein
MIRDVVSSTEWKFDFTVSEDEDGGCFHVEDSEGRYVCSCSSEESALTIAGALNETWKDKRWPEAFATLHLHPSDTAWP